jgi:hypothetical protein
VSAVEPILFSNAETLSFRQIDEMNGLNKGTTFRLFKQCQEALVEGIDYFYLPEESHETFIRSLKASAQIYQSTTHLVLFTRCGYTKLQNCTT